MGRKIQRSAESAAEVAPERVEPDVFSGQRVRSVHVEFAAALGLSDVGPVGRAVAGTGEAVGLHEGLQQQRPVAVASLPVVGQPAAAARQHRGSEIAHLHPGQDQEAGVVHHQLQARFALRNAPADEAVAGSRLPGAGAKADHRQHAPLAGDQVAHLCSRQRRIAEVVVTVHVLAPQLRFALIGQRSYLQRRQRIDAGDDWQFRFRLRGAAAVQRAVVVGPARRRQPDEPVAVHAQHRHPTAHVLQLAVGASPVQPFAHQPREGEPMAGGVLGDERADQLHLPFAEQPSAVAHRLRRHGSRPPWRARRAARAPRGGSRAGTARSPQAPDRRRPHRRSDTRSATYAG